MTLLLPRSWRELAPEAWSYDEERAREIVDEALARTRRRGDLAREAVESLIDRALAVEFGGALAGWRWSASEPGGGGPVSAWCCATHSIWPEGEARDGTTARVLAALAQWRDFVGELGRAFAALQARTAALGAGEAVELAAAQLLPIVLERTGAEDAWYNTMSSVLRWFVEAAGQDADTLEPIIDGVISGRFESWVAPDEEQARAAFAELRQAVARAPSTTGPPRDALAEWLRVREPAFAAELELSPRLREPVRDDGHRRLLRRELADDGARAARMMLALDACRASAARGEALDLARVQEWQALVLGQPHAPLRRGDAFAKGGRERYGLDGETFAQLERALAQANDAALPAVCRAARVYLDVCFFHPFADGNARAARLALDHVLTRAGLALHAAAPLFSVARAASDVRGARMFVYVVDYLSGPPAPRVG